MRNGSSREWKAPAASTSTSWSGRRLLPSRRVGSDPPNPEILLPLHKGFLPIHTDLHFAIGKVRPIGDRNRSDLAITSHSCARVRTQHLTLADDGSCLHVKARRMTRSMGWERRSVGSATGTSTTSRSGAAAKLRPSLCAQGRHLKDIPISTKPRRLVKHIFMVELSPVGSPCSSQTAFAYSVLGPPRGSHGKPEKTSPSAIGGE